MSSAALKTFDHAIEDSLDLLSLFDELNGHPPSPKLEVLKRASLIMALAALETYFEDRALEAIIALTEGKDGHLSNFTRKSLEADLKSFHSPSTERVRALFKKYLFVDVTSAWSWNNCDPAKARKELDRLVKKRGDIAHRSLRPSSETPSPHAVTRNELRKIIHFIRQLAKATDLYLSEKV